MVDNITNSNLINCTSKAKAPINIALIKYWGKSDEKEVIPLNDSLSITLDMENMFTETTVHIEEINNSQKGIVSTSLILNGE